MRHIFVPGDIGGVAYVDRSIYSPVDLVQTNVMSTYQLLESVRGYWVAFHSYEKTAFSFFFPSNTC